MTERLGITNVMTAPELLDSVDMDDKWLAVAAVCLLQLSVLRNPLRTSCGGGVDVGSVDATYVVLIFLLLPTVFVF